ncbi:DNA polymerase delta subunit 3 isoform X2 [Halyomorpha halys]
MGGELKNGKGRLLKLVIGDSKEAVKQIFSKITTDHIFSIQRSGCSFSSTDIFNSFPHFSVLPETRRFCPVRPVKEIEKREINYITDAKNFLNPSVPVKKQIVTKDTESSKRESKNEEGSKPPKSENSTDSSEPSTKLKRASGNEKDLKSKGGNIGSFFSRQTEKKNSDQPAGNKGKSEKKEEKAKTGIGAFFKPGNKSDISTKEVIEKGSTLKSEKKEDEKKEAPEVKKQNGVTEPVSAPPTKDKKKKTKESKRKRKKKDDDGTEKKRRKRIVSALSSDSESSGNETSDCEMEVEPEQPPPPPPVVEEDEDMIPPTPGRKRVRKQIDKVSMDDDGFIITKKEFVYESCSDDEAKGEKKENKENNTKEDKIKLETPLKRYEISQNNVKQNKSPNNDKSNKQSSITNFFKRKAVT